MNVLVAPNKSTVDRISSAGTVSFVEGIATEFTKEQAQHFCQNLPGYSLMEIETPEEAEAERVAQQTRDEAAAKSAAEVVKEMVEETTIDDDQNDDQDGPPESEEAPEDEEAETTKTEDSDTTTETSQDASDDAQAAPADVSPVEGTGDQVKAETAEEVANNAEPIVLPIMKNNIPTIHKFCDEYGIDKNGTKREMLERIYADPRFKK